ncbi:MAG TPA: antitoxin family protein [Polyangiaceae bacterium]|nr:antitoxin family protein [Polyangiaceae bacterium]
MPRVLRARVTMGRLTLDEPTDLPEGTEVELVVVSRAGDADAREAHASEGGEPKGARFLSAPAAPEDEPPASGAPDAIIEQVQRQTRG